MRNHLKKAALLFGLTLAMTLAACTNHVSDTGQNSKSNTPTPDSKSTVQTVTPTPTPAETNTQNNSSRPLYAFINGYLLGSYDNGVWHSLCNIIDDHDADIYKSSKADTKAFYAKDLLNQDCYYVYDEKKLLGVSKQIIWITEEASGLGCFEDADAPKKFAKYGKLYSYDGSSDTLFYRIFDLPMELGNELSTLKIPNYSFSTEFVFGEKWQRRFESFRLATSSSNNIFPRALSYGTSPTSKGKQSLADLFKEKSIENTVPNFTDCVLGDFDNDGKNEYLMIADAAKGESGYPLLRSNGKTDHVGTFNVILYQDDDGSIKTLYSDLRQYKYGFKPDKDNKMELLGGPGFCEIDLLTIADLNSDGIYEIGVNMGRWESGSYLVYAMNNKGEYEVVMRSNNGM